MPLDHTPYSTDAEIEAFLLNDSASEDGFSASLEGVHPPSSAHCQMSENADSYGILSKTSADSLHAQNPSDEAELVAYTNHPHTFASTSSSTTPTKRSPDHSTPESGINEVGQAYAFMVHKSKRPNLAFTLNLRSHSDYREQRREQSLLREAILQSLTYQFRMVTGDHFQAVHAYENSNGGHGIHVHFLAYCPPEHYSEMVRQLRSAFAKKYVANIDKLLVDHASKMAAHSIKLRRRASAPEKYDALVQLRHAMKARAFKKLVAEMSDAGVSPASLSDADFEAVVRSRIILPFWVSSPDAPLSEASSLKELRYLCKSADPTITREYRGKLCTLEELSRDGELGKDGFLLEKQARRFTHANVASSRCVGPGARAADPTFTPPKDVISELLIPRLASDCLHLRARQAILTLRLEELSRGTAPKTPTEAAEAGCHAALKRVRETAESRRATFQALLDALGDRLGDLAPQHTSTGGADEAALAAIRTTRRRAEIPKAQAKTLTGEDDKACIFRHSVV